MATWNLARDFSPSLPAEFTPLPLAELPQDGSEVRLGSGDVSWGTSFSRRLTTSSTRLG